MNINDIIALSKAGFNSEQIAQMAQLEAQQPAAPAPEAAPAPAPRTGTSTGTGTRTGHRTPAPAPVPDNKADFDAIMAAIGGLKVQMQQSAIQTAQQPAQPTKTADDLIATIINPPAAVNDK